ncbi:disulfide bond formation protein B [Candidatus Kaiserbacteria bacterium]|nr:disulfide bond formation protein B [Candidatus Kaiserbacteria bacterium]
MPVETLNYLLALGTLAMQVAGAGFFALYFLQKKFTDLQDIAALLSRWGLWLGFLLTLGVTAMTLYYSEVLGFAPCGWCWVQRVFLWPQALLFGVALYKQERSVADFSIAFSIFGAAAALYQHYLQMGGGALIPCPASGAGDCAQRILFEFGYITFPLMSATLFCFLIVLMLFVRRSTASS